MTIVFVVLCNLSIIPISWSEECQKKERFDADTLKIGLALSQFPIIDPEAQQLAMTFVGNTLPKLLAEDPILARQVGFTSAQDLYFFQESGAMLEAPLPLFVIDINDIRNFVKNDTHPLTLLTKGINWTGGSGETLEPAHFLFPISLRHDAAHSGSPPKSSVMIEKTTRNSWRIHHVGGPTLIRAVKMYSTRERDFVVWIPTINRHYLGRMGTDFRFKMTVLFDDPLARVNAGHEFDPCESDVLDKLRKLDELLVLTPAALPVGVIPAPIKR